MDLALHVDEQAATNVCVAVAALYGSVTEKTPRRMGASLEPATPTIPEYLPARRIRLVAVSTIPIWADRITEIDGVGVSHGTSIPPRPEGRRGTD